MSGSYRKYLGGSVVAFAVGVVYALLGVTMVASTMNDQYQPSPGMAALGDLAIWVMFGLTLVPLALGGIYFAARQVLGVERGLGCASILFSAVSGVALAFGVLYLSAPPPSRVSGGWVEGPGYSVHVPTLLACSSHPAMSFAPGVVGPAFGFTGDCCSIVSWAEGRSDAAEPSVAQGPEVLHEPTSGPAVWNDLDGFADYLAGTDDPGGGAFARTEVEAEAGRAIRLDDDRTRPSSAYLFAGGSRYYSVACSDPDPPDDRWFSIAETFGFLPAGE
jgi:hypothetical protein